ncbi:hypothetical protein [Streptomyces spectabilis]|uniref:Tat pathway signal sequence domain protein n=1 Tax=Streptomyces spectabilis TaxID=68270 RepID=A0A7W8B6E7_STRST|nr:hypothetical protein [Streptomyces spectabilis]MBB5109433.1 hypothetical protein [Streptomyces spectabilis]MCI3907783.1 hypothetical protein [Streptomyces spectabilis]GGV53583.1 hypothetical protein GCM10010245_84680 [Streptomyces spectabilis]
MNRALRALAGATVLCALAAGTATAAPPGDEAALADLSLPEGFHAPGPETIVERTVPVQPVPGDDVADAIKADGLLKKTPGDSVIKIKNKRYQGQNCGTRLLQQTSGRGKTTLVLTVSKSVATERKSEAKISAGTLSAAMGFSVSKSYTVENQTRYEVPKGRFGTIQAYPLYDHYTYQAVLGKIKRSGYVLKPVGVCFNQWTTKA